MAHLPPDHLACAIAWLSSHPQLPLQLRAGGATDGAARVSSRDLGEYPCLRVQLTPAGAGGVRWQVNAELMLELLDSPEAALQLGDEEQLGLLQRTLWLLAELPDAPQPLPGRREVVTLVGPGAGAARVTDPGVPGQPRWLATVTVNAHPAAEPQIQED